MVHEVEREGYCISTDPARLELDVVHDFLKTAYWSTGIPRDVLERAVENSIPFGLYSDEGAQVGFARVVSDRATFAYLGDVFVLPEHRGRGLGVWLLETVMAHPVLQGLRRWMLATDDAHGLYRKSGFAALADPGIYMAVEVGPVELWGTANG